jgi:sugar lactone lactonase YvrE
LNQLTFPHAIFVDNDNTIYIADSENNRIVQWKYGEKEGQVIAGGNGKGNRNDQLNYPTDIIIDKRNNSLIIADRYNRRVMRCSSENQQVLISDIDCHGLRMDKDGFIYVSDCVKNEVRRWKQGEKEGIKVAGGNGKGNRLNQLSFPTFIFVDDDSSVYVSDCENHRVMKWRKDAKEGIVVAGGNGQGDSLKQLSKPYGVIVDHFGHIYVVASGNDRVVCWCEGSTEGSIVLGGNGVGNQSNQMNCPKHLSFDVEGNLYVVDSGNARIQKFEVDFD